MPFARGLRPPIRFHALHDVPRQRREQGSVLTGSGCRMAGVHVSGGDEDEQSAAAGQSRGGAPDLARLAGDIDHHIPLVAGALVVGVRAVPVSPLERRAGRGGARLTASQAGDLMPAFHCSCRDAAAKPRRAAENEKPHVRSRRPVGVFAQHGSPTAQRPPAECPQPYAFVWIGALTQKVPGGDRAVNVHALIAAGVNADGKRAITGLQRGQHG